MSWRRPTSRASTGTGTRPAIGAGIYRRDIPVTCESEEVHAFVILPVHGPKGILTYMSEDRNNGH